MNDNNDYPPSSFGEAMWRSYEREHKRMCEEWAEAGRKEREKKEKTNKKQRKSPNLKK